MKRRPRRSVWPATMSYAAIALGLTLAAPAQAVVIWEEVGGQVVIEAEQPFSVTKGASGDEWRIVHDDTTMSNSRGDGWIQALPDGGAGGGTPFAGTGASATYLVWINTPGTYRLWHRGAGSDGGGDSYYGRFYHNTPGDYYLLDPTTTTNFDNTWEGSGYQNASGYTVPYTATNFTAASPGLYTLEIDEREDGTRLDAFVLDRTGTFTPSNPGPAASAAPAKFAFVESGGLAVVEAEHFKSSTVGVNDSYMVETVNTETDGVYTTTEVQGRDGPRNGLYVRPGPNNDTSNSGTPFDTGPTLSYDILFETAGQYQAWIRSTNDPGGVAAGNDDSLYVRLYQGTPDDFFLVTSLTDAWGWQGTGLKNATGYTVPAESMLFDVTPGLWTVEIAMREDGTDFDAFLFALNGTFDGTGIGPAESAFLVVPEPSALAMLLGGGLLGLLGYLRRRRR